MGYFVRAFCSAATSPPLDHVLQALGARGVTLAPESGDPGDLREPDWEELAISWAADRPALQLTCSREDGSGRGELREEIQQFMDFVRDAPESGERRRVLDHLRATRFVVACQVPDENDERGHAAALALVSFFARHGKGLTQIDGKGFFDGDALLLPAE
jgi:hypothetical protein